MRPGGFHRFGEVRRLQKEESRQSCTVRWRASIALGVRTQAVLLIAQFSRIQLPALVVLPQCPRSHFVGAAFLVRLGELRWALLKEEDKLFHRESFTSPPVSEDNAEATAWLGAFQSCTAAYDWRRQR